MDNTHGPRTPSREPVVHRYTPIVTFDAFRCLLPPDRGCSRTPVPRRCLVKGRQTLQATPDDEGQGTRADILLATGIAVTVVNAPDDNLEHEDRNSVAEITVRPDGG